MKGIFWIIVIVAIAVFIYISLNLTAKRIGFNFSLSSLDFSKLSLSDFKSDNAHIGVKVNTLVTNLNPFNINFSFLEVWIFSEGVLIAQSSEVLQGKINATGGSVTNFILPLDLYIKPQLVKIAALLKLKRPIQIDYTIKLKLFGVPLPKYSDKYTING